MTAPVPNREPDRLSAATTWQWRRDDLASDYPAGQGWTFAYAFQCGASAKFTVDGGDIVADGDSFVVTVALGDTTSIEPGNYQWALRAIAPAAGGTFEVDRGNLLVLPSLDSADPRSHARKVLDAIQAVIEGRAARSDLSYEVSVNGSLRRLSSIPHKDLFELRRVYQAEVAAEEERDRVAQGRGGRRRIFSRFARPVGFVPGGNWPYRR